MGEFIKVIIDRAKCGSPEEIQRWVRVCPVNIFKMDGDAPVVVEENEDECTLCDLCRQQADTPGAVAIVKLYER